MIQTNLADIHEWGFTTLSDILTKPLDDCEKTDGVRDSDLYRVHSNIDFNRVQLKLI